MSELAGDGVSIMMDDDIVIYAFEATCPLSVVIRQQLPIRSPL